MVGFIAILERPRGFAMRRRLFAQLAVSAAAGDRRRGAGDSAWPGRRRRSADAGEVRRIDLPIARHFGCAEFRWAAFGAGKRTMMLEYIPTGTELNGWKRLMTATVFALPPDAAGQHDAMMNSWADSWRTTPRGGSSPGAYSDAKGDPRAFIELRSARVC
jgi:hypothetical protein